MVVLRFVSLLFLFQSGCAFENSEYKVINKIPRSPLMRYYSYSSVMILHFYIPDDTIEASFQFKAIDEQTSIFMSKCEPRNISIYMKPGSYPVINPDGVSLPKTFLNISRPNILEKIILTDEKTNYINISSPKPGDWFAVAFISWTDPRKEKIEQQGLTSRCEASLCAELAIVDQQNIQTISLNNRIEIPLKQNQIQLFKFYIPEDIDHVLIEIEIGTPCKHCKNESILIYVQTGSVPMENKYQEKLLIEGKEEGKKYLWFWPEEETWHYINISFVSEVKDYTSVALKLKYISGLLEEMHTIPNTTDKRINLFKTSVDKKLTLRNEALRYNLPYKQYNLMRVSGSENFVFEYDFRPNINGSTPLLLNLTTSEMTILKFMVQEIVDIGGTLSIGLAIKPDLKTKTYSEKYKVVACIRANSREIPTYPNLCTFNNTSSKAPIVLNSTTAGTLEYFHIPYPDPGMYYMSIRAFYDSCVPCNCSEDCEQDFEDCLLECELNCTTDCNKCTDKCENEILDTDGCENCDCDGDCWRGNDTLKNTSVIYAITSNPCIAGTCGKRGSCNHYMAGGFIFSSCHCRGGYRGWDCTDGSLALSDSEILVAILLLTLSNLLFIPSIYFAYRRGYYTEAVTYFCSMFASTFYHACDSRENQFGFCLFPHGVLQFCDFYCALLTIWVTLVAMSYTSTRIISLAHIIGAIILAFSVTYNKHALWVAALPALFGIFLVGSSWGMQCRKTKKLFPAKTYLKLYMPVGGALVFMGLISFAFLETKQNYKIVHSLWHIMMALSLIFLLPNNKVFIPKN